MRARLMDGERVEVDSSDPSQLRLTLPVCMRMRGGRTRIIGGAAPEAQPDPILIKALRAAHAMVGRDAAGLPVLDAAPASPYRRRLVRLAFLSPALQNAILTGRQPSIVTLGRLLETPLPPLWTEQSRLFGHPTPN